VVVIDLVWQFYFKNLVTIRRFDRTLSGPYQEYNTKKSPH